MRTLTIIQARLGSKRLPGKVLERIGDKTVLEHVIDRVREADLGPMVVATPSLWEDAPIRELAGKLGVDSFAGATDDVLHRFVRAQESFMPDADAVVRVTADCPFLDPTLLVAVALTLTEGYDYAGVVGAPDGLHQEAFTVDALLRAHAYAKAPVDREHVVPWMMRNLRCGWVEVDMPGEPCTLDTPEDLERLRTRFLAESALRVLSALTGEGSLRMGA